MRYGAIPKGLRERLATVIGAVPYPMLDVLIAPVQARALMAAQRTGVLELLAGDSQATDRIASRLALDASCLELVLRLLASMGYLKRRHGRWSLTRMGERHFGPRATHPLGEFVAFGVPQWEWISRLEETLRTGAPVEIHRTLRREDWDLYQRAMADGAREFAGFVAGSLPVPRGARLCLDVAGSHGIVGGALCRAHPGMEAIVLERPEAMAEARRLCAREGLFELVTFRECDLLKDEFGASDADVVILANILHHFDASRIHEILARARRALRPGGLVGVFDIEVPEADAAPEAGGDGAALFFRITSNGACYRGADYLAWLEEAGFAAPKIVRNVRLPSRLLAFGRAV